MSRDTVVLVPARFKSTRYPGKPLVELCGKPMIIWVLERCRDAVGKDAVFAVTDDKRIASVVEEWGFTFVMTASDALTGTDRVAEAAQKIDAKIYVNVQGDEPLVNPADILAIVEEKRKYPDCVINGYCPIASDEHVDSVNLPKVVFTEDRRLVYMSRSRIPGSKSEAGWPEAFHKQVCIYGYDRNELRLYTSVGRKSTLERIEDIEILRFLDLGKTVRMIETSSGTLSVDVPQDVGPVEKALKAMMGRN